MTDRDLKPCPFCGETEHLRMRSSGCLVGGMPDRPYRVACFHIDHDDVLGPVGYGEFEAAKLWNHRPMPVAEDVAHD